MLFLKYSAVLLKILLLTLPFCLVNAQKPSSDLAGLEAEFLRITELGLVQKAFIYAEDILTKFPPQEYTIVSFGTSQTVLEAALEIVLEQPKFHEFKEQAKMNRYLWRVPVLKSSGLFTGADTDLPHIKTRALFRSYLPSEKQLAGRKLVFLRTLNQGITIHYALELARWYFESSASEPRVFGYYILRSQGADQASGSALAMGEFSNLIMPPAQFAHFKGKGPETHQVYKMAELKVDDAWHSEFILGKAEFDGQVFRGYWHQFNKYREINLREVLASFRTALYFPELEKTEGYSALLELMRKFYAEQGSQICQTLLDSGDS